MPELALPEVVPTLRVFVLVFPVVALAFAVFELAPLVLVLGFPPAVIVVLLGVVLVVLVAPPPVVVPGASTVVISRYTNQKIFPRFVIVIRWRPTDERTSDV